MFKNIIIILLVLTNIYFISQYREASYCANAWAGMYWNTQERVIWLEEEIERVKFME